jgi:hypothetical protein
MVPLKAASKQKGGNNEVGRRRDKNGSQSQDVALKSEDSVRVVLHDKGGVFTQNMGMRTACSCLGV